MPNPFKLINEWRDTIFITALVIACGCGWIAARDVFFATSMREVVRSLAWIFMPPEHVVGGARGPDAGEVNYGATVACYVTGIAMALHPIAWLGLGINTTFLLIVSWRISFLSSWSSVAQNYVAAWDWPRKRSGGPGEWEKLKSLVARPHGLATEGVR